MQHIYYPRLNLVVLVEGELNKDADLKYNLVQMIQLDELESRRILKDEYFTILAHGKKDSLSGLNDQASLGWIHMLYTTYGKGRNILLLSCNTAHDLSRDVAMMLRKQVVAPLGLATFDFATGDIRIEGDMKWTKCSPAGEAVPSKSSVLTAEFLR